MQQQVLLTSEQVSKLEAHILEMPGKFSIPLLQLISGFIQENNKPEIQEAKVLGTVD